MPKTIGIDLGTTNSAMAVMEGGEPVATSSAATTSTGWGWGRPLKLSTGTAAGWDRDRPGSPSR